MKISFESKGDFDVISSWLKRVTQHKPTVVADQIAREGTRALSANTPRDTGETASGWTSEITTKGDVTEIAWKNTAHPESEANVAKLIELGHGTRTGEYVAPKHYIKEAMKPVWDTASDKVVKELIK
jgi:hypothetical protein